MGMNKQWLAAGAAVLVLGGGLLVAVNSGAADENDKKAKAAVEKIMKALEDGKKDDAAKDAKALAGTIEDMEPAMNVMGLRDEGGFGFGKKPGKDPKKDSIEEKVEALANEKLSKEEVKDQADDLAKMGFAISAVAHVAQAKPAPTGEKVKGKPADWKKFSKELGDHGLELATLAKSGKATPEDIQKIGKTLNDTCMKCHEGFK
jgi:hypothetical protein